MMMIFRSNQHFMFLDIEPKGKARHRDRAVITKSGRAFTTHYPDPRQKNYVKELTQLIRYEYQGDLIQGAVEVLWTALMPIPKSWSKKKRQETYHTKVPHIKKPDSDNLEKMLFDCMNGIVWKDDCQVWRVFKEKRYSVETGWCVTIIGE